MKQPDVFYNPSPMTADPKAITAATAPSFDDIAQQLQRKKRMQRMNPVASPVANTGAVPSALAQALLRYGVK